MILTVVASRRIDTSPPKTLTPLPDTNQRDATRQHNFNPNPSTTASIHGKWTPVEPPDDVPIVDEEDWLAALSYEPEPEPTVRRQSLVRVSTFARSWRDGLRLAQNREYSPVFIGWTESPKLNNATLAADNEEIEVRSFLSLRSSRFLTETQYIDDDELPRTQDTDSIEDVDRVLHSARCCFATRALS